MAVISLLESTPKEDILNLGYEENKPEFIFPKDDQHGVSGRYGDYALVEAKVSGRTIKEGEYAGKVERYTKWIDINYASTFWQAIKNYIDYKSLSDFKTKKDLSVDDIKKIYLDIQITICDALKSCVSYDEIKDICKLYDTKHKLINEVNELRNDINHCKKLLHEANQMYAAIKDKHKIIVSDMPKNKKHKIEEETA